MSAGVAAGSGADVHRRRQTDDAVAALAGIGRATFYRRPELRALIAEHRHQARDALTLTGLAVQIDQLRDSLEAVAGKSAATKTNSAVSIGPFLCQPHLDSGGGHRDGWPTGCRHRWRCRPQTVQHFSG